MHKELKTVLKAFLQHLNLSFSCRVRVICQGRLPGTPQVKVQEPQSWLDLPQGASDLLWPAVSSGSWDNCLSSEQRTPF